MAISACWKDKMIHALTCMSCTNYIDTFYEEKLMMPNLMCTFSQIDALKSLDMAEYQHFGSPASNNV